MNGSQSHSNLTPPTASAAPSGMQSPLPEIEMPTPVQFNQLSPQLLKDSSRIDVDSLMNEFRQELGATRWEIYRDSLTHFLMGKLSRAELVRCLREQLGLNGAAMRNHNTLVLSLLANACREAPPGAESSLADWKANTRNKNKHSGMDPSNDLLHREILSLPVRERRRIKNIAKEAANYIRNPLFPLPAMDSESSRYAMLPRIPLAHDQVRNADGASNSTSNTGSASAAAAAAAASLNGTAAGAAAAASNIAAHANSTATASSAGVGANASAVNAAESSPPNVRKDKEKESNPLMDPLLNLHPGRTSGPLTWTQDIIQGLDTPLISESHELPDESTLGTRMLSIALENGVLGGIGPGTTDIMLLGLESYFRSIIDQLFELKHREITSENPLNAADFDLLAELRPTELGDRSAPLLRLKTFYLQDEETDENDEHTTVKDGEDDQGVNPWNFDDMRAAKRVKIEESEEKKKAWDEHQRGIALVDQLLRQ